MCVLCRAFGSDLANVWHAGGASDADTPAPAYANAVNVGKTGDQDVDGVLSGYRWSGTVTYSFTDSASDYQNGYGSGEHKAPGFGAISATQQRVVHDTMAQIEGLTNQNIEFKG